MGSLQIFSPTTATIPRRVTASPLPSGAPMLVYLSRCLPWRCGLNPCAGASLAADESGGGHRASMHRRFVLPGLGSLLRFRQSPSGNLPAHRSWSKAGKPSPHSSTISDHCRPASGFSADSEGSLGIFCLAASRATLVATEQASSCNRPRGQKVGQAMVNSSSPQSNTPPIIAPNSSRRSAQPTNEARGCYRSVRIDSTPSSLSSSF